jgi:mRNA-degrading endonuclease toxin of MazEF toxin-antitoxin module
VLTRASGLDRDGFVKVDQVFTRPADRLGTRIGRLNPETMERLDAALRFVLAV